MQFLLFSICSTRASLSKSCFYTSTTALSFPMHR